MANLPSVPEEQPSRSLQAYKELVGRYANKDSSKVVVLGGGRIIESEEAWEEWDGPERETTSGFLENNDTIVLEIVLNGQNHHVRMPLQNTLLQLKQQLLPIISFSVEHQILTRKNRVLRDDSQTINELGLMSGHTLDLTYKPASSFLYVNQAPWWTFLVDIVMTERVAQLKKKIGEKFKISQNKLILKTAGQILSNEDRLEKYDLQSGDCVELQYRLTGIKKTITITLPEGVEKQREFDENISVNNLEVAAAALGNRTVSQILLMYENSVIVKTKRPITLIPTSLNLHVLQHPDHFVLVEYVKEGCVHLLENPASLTDIKETLERKFAHTQSKQLLVKEGNVLEDASIEKLEMEKKIPIQLYLTSDKIRIYVQKSESAWITIEPFYLNPILLLKNRIEDLKGIPANQQLLLFNKVLLDDYRTLFECHILPNSTLLLLSLLPPVPQPSAPESPPVRAPSSPEPRKIICVETKIRQLMVESGQPAGRYQLLV